MMRIITVIPKLELHDGQVNTHVHKHNFAAMHFTETTFSLEITIINASAANIVHPFETIFQQQRYLPFVSYIF